MAIDRADVEASWQERPAVGAPPPPAQAPPVDTVAEHLELLLADPLWQAYTQEVLAWIQTARQNANILAQALADKTLSDPAQERKIKQALIAEQAAADALAQALQWPAERIKQGAHVQQSA